MTKKPARGPWGGSRESAGRPALPSLTRAQAQLMADALKELSSQALFPEHAARFRELADDLDAVLKAMRPGDTLKVTRPRKAKDDDEKPEHLPNF